MLWLLWKPTSHQVYIHEDAAAKFLKLSILNTVAGNKVKFSAAESSGMGTEKRLYKKIWLNESNGLYIVD